MFAAYIAAGGPLMRNAETVAKETSQKNRFLALGLLALTVFIGGCHSAPRSGPNDNTQGQDRAGTSANSGAITGNILIKKTIDQNGGVIRAPDNSPLQGVVVEFPKGALTRSNDISLGYVIEPVSTKIRGVSAGAKLVLHSSSETRFAKPVQVTIPDPDGVNNPTLLFFESEDGELQTLNYRGTDLRAKTVIFDIGHLSKYARVSVPIKSDQDVDTGFLPERNGFQVVNQGTEYIGGSCLGFAMFAQWYFAKNGQKNPLYNKYMNVVPSFTGKKMVSQLIIATRAAFSGMYADLFLAQTGGLSSQYLKAVLYSTGKPNLISLWSQRADPSDNHAVLAYATRGDDILVYDPNKPGKGVVLIPFLKDPQDPLFTVALRDEGGVYDEYKHFQFTGPGSYKLSEPFEFIKKDADAEFYGENEVKLDATPKDESKVSPGTLTAHVKLHRGQSDVVQIEVTSPGDDNEGTVTQKVAIAEEQEEFDVTVRVFGGSNLIKFTTRKAQTFGDLINNLDRTVVQNSYQASSDAANSYPAERTIYELDGGIRPVLLKYSTLYKFKGTSLKTCSASYHIFDGTSPKEKSQFVEMMEKIGNNFQLGWGQCSPQYRCAYGENSPLIKAAYTGWLDVNTANTGARSVDELLDWVGAKKTCKGEGGVWGGPIMSDGEILEMYKKGMSSD